MPAPWWCCCNPKPPAEEDDCIEFDCAEQQCTFKHPSTIIVSGYRTEVNAYVNANATAPNAACNGRQIRQAILEQNGSAILHSVLAGDGTIAFWTTKEPARFSFSGWGGFSEANNACQLVIVETADRSGTYHLRMLPSCCGGDFDGQVAIRMGQLLTGESRHPESNLVATGVNQSLYVAQQEKISGSAVINECLAESGTRTTAGDNFNTVRWSKTFTHGCAPSDYTYTETVARAVGWSGATLAKAQYSASGAIQGPSVDDLDTIYASVSGIFYKTDCIDFLTQNDGKYTAMPTSGGRISSGGYVAMSKVTPVGVDRQWEGRFSGVEWTDYSTTNGLCGAGAAGRGTDDMLIRLSRIGSVYTIELFSDIDSAGSYGGAPFMDRFFVAADTLNIGCAELAVLKRFPNDLTLANWDGSPGSEPLDSTLTLDLGHSGTITLATQSQ